MHQERMPEPMIEIEGKRIAVGPDGFSRFGDIAIDILEQQCQYASRYVDGKFTGYPNLGEGLRFRGNTDDYHALLIHSEDIPKFLKRYREHQNAR